MAQTKKRMPYKAVSHLKAEIAMQLFCAFLYLTISIPAETVKQFRRVEF